MDREELYNTLTGAYGPLFDSIEMWACIKALNAKLTNVRRNGIHKWRFAASFDGCDIEIVGCGETIYEAAKAFYYGICQTKAERYGKD